MATGQRAEGDEHHSDGARVVTARRRSVPMWPQFRRSSARQHTLAEQRDGTIVAVDGEVFDASTYESFVTTATSHRLDVRVSELDRWRWLADALRDGRATVSVVKNKKDVSPRVVGIEWVSGRDHAKAFDGSAWGKGVENDHIEGANRLLGETGYSSPSGLGQQTMHTHTRGRYTTESKAVNKDLQAALIGGRAELVKPIRIGQCVEIDRRMAYVDEARKELPVGSASAWDGPDLPPAYYRWWVACCGCVLTSW